VWLPDCPRCGASGISWQTPEDAMSEAAAEVFLEAATEEKTGAGTGLERRPRPTIPLYSPSFHVSKSGRLMRPSWLLATMVIVTTAVLAVAMGGGRGEEARAAAPEIEPNDAVVVTFRNGDKCLVRDWRFRYLRIYRGDGEADGPTESAEAEHVEEIEDEVLRYYGGLGEHRALRPWELRSIQLALSPGETVEQGFSVSETRVITERFTDQLRPSVAEGSSQTRLLVPDARHFWPNAYDDDPAKVEGVSIHLVGSFSEGCPAPGHIDLSTDRHDLASTPIRIELPSE
jgi:hypothetical protein